MCPSIAHNAYPPVSTVVYLCVHVFGLFAICAEVLEARCSSVVLCECVGATLHCIPISQLPAWLTHMRLICEMQNCSQK